jgi:hypothetical protein
MKNNTIELIDLSTLKLSQNVVQVYNDSERGGAPVGLSVHDLNDDGIKELFLTSAHPFIDANLVILNVGSDAIENVTQSYIDDQSAQLDGHSDILVDDFNGDGLLDFISRYSKDNDIELGRHSLFLGNEKGGYDQSFLKEGGLVHSHDATLFDMNNDGVKDFIPLNYVAHLETNGVWLSDGEGLVFYEDINSQLGGSSIAVADYDQDGRAEIILTDTDADKGTRLYTYQLDRNEKTITIEEEAVLPDSRFNLPKHKDILLGHEVKTQNIDFDKDGDVDVIIYSRPDIQDGNWISKSELQFLENDGKGSFSDITDRTLLGYDINTEVAYGGALLKDDIFLGAHGEDARFLVKSAGGYYYAAFKDEISDFHHFAHDKILEFRNGLGVSSDSYSFYVYDAGLHSTYDTTVFEQNGKYFIASSLRVNQNGNDNVIVYSAELDPARLDQFRALIVESDKDAHKLALQGDTQGNILIGGLGSNQIDGGLGIDTAAYTGNQASYTIALGASATTVNDRRADGDRTDTLTNIEVLDFAGETFDLTKFGGTSGLSEQNFETFIELYIAYFNRAPDAIGLNFWGTAFANGTSLEETATLFEGQDETKASYPDGTSNGAFAETVYDNVLGRTPDVDGLNFWVGQLDDGKVSRDQFILEVLNGVKAGTPDRAYLDNKVDLGAYFAVHKGMSDAENAKAIMDLFGDQDVSNTSGAKTAIDDYYMDALDPTNGEFLLQVVGVLDNPFDVA